MMTALAWEAYRAGADWIVPVDADEFWSAGRRRLAQALERWTAGAIEARVVNFVQDRRSRDRGDAALLTMTGRVAQPHAYQQCRELIESGRIASVEMEYPSKWLPRAVPDLQILAGAHGVNGNVGARTASPQIVCLHAPIRSRSVLDARAEHGRRLLEGGYSLHHGWQNQRWYRLQAEGKLEAEWDANSTKDGHLKSGTGALRFSSIPACKCRLALDRGR